MYTWFRKNILCSFVMSRINDVDNFWLSGVRMTVYRDGMKFAHRTGPNCPLRKD